MNIFHLKLRSETELYIAAESWAKAFETHALSEYNGDPVMGIEVMGYGDPVLVQSCVELENELKHIKSMCAEYREIHKDDDARIDELIQQRDALHAENEYLKSLLPPNKA